jgi:hypothetical protein
MRLLALSCLLASALLPSPVVAQSSSNRDPEAARIVTDDLPRFWQAFDEASRAGDEAGREAAFARYLAAGSPGLRQFDRLRIEGAAKLAKTVAAHPRYYASLRGQPARVAAFEAPIRASLRELKAIHPEAVFPDVYLLVGRMNSGGTLDDVGLLIGLEMHGREAGTPDEELGDWHRAVLKGLDGLPVIVAHELVHYQQRGQAGDSLLAASLNEGVADFIAERIAGRHINAHVHAWAEPRAAELWLEFQQHMHGSDYAGWLYGGTADRPADLGYWMGYRIARAYYERTPDKRAAIRAMLDIDDAQAFLDASGFAALMAAGAAGD